MNDIEPNKGDQFDMNTNKNKSQILLFFTAYSLIFLFILLLTSCSSIEDEIKDIPISHLIKTNDDRELNEVLEDYKYMKEFYYNINRDDEFGQYFFIIFSVNIQHEDYRKLYGSTSQDEKIYIIFSLGKDATSVINPNRFQWWHGNTMIINIGGKKRKFDINPSYILSKISKNELIYVE